jgi:hypothetical protein
VIRARRIGRRVALAIGVLGVAWLAALLVLDDVLAPRQARGTEARLTESLHATTTVGEAELELVRGALELDALAVRRDDVVGHLALDIGSVRCELLPLGLALVDGDCRELAVRGTRLDVNAAALLQIAHPKRPPIHARRVVVDDGVLVFAPSAFAPGLGRIEIAIDHAVAGETVLRTPLSWLFSLEELRAHLELPAGISLQVTYGRGTLAVAGTLFGSEPVELPIELPHAGVASDGKAELALLVATGKQIAERLVEKRADDWLRGWLR